MLSPSQKTQALDLFQVPATFRAAALKMLSTQELELILLMEQKIWPEQELMDAIQKNGIADSPAVLICTAYERAVLNKKRAEDNALCWQIADFYTRYPHYAQYEPEEYLKLPRETIQALNQWDFAVYYGSFYIVTFYAVEVCIERNLSRVACCFAKSILYWPVWKGDFCKAHSQKSTITAGRLHR